MRWVRFLSQVEGPNNVNCCGCRPPSFIIVDPTPLRGVCQRLQHNFIVSPNPLIYLNKIRFRTLVSECAAMRSKLVVEELRGGEPIGWLGLRELRVRPIRDVVERVPWVRLRKAHYCPGFRSSFNAALCGTAGAGAGRASSRQNQSLIGWGYTWSRTM